jgi:hypothetical protein
MFIDGASFLEAAEDARLLQYHVEATRKHAMSFVDNSDGTVKGGARLSNVAALMFVAMVRKRMRAGQIGSMGSKYNRDYLNWKRRHFGENVNKYWILTGKLASSLGTVRTGDKSWGVGIHETHQGVRRGSKRIGSAAVINNAIPVAKYAKFGIIGSGGRGRRYQPPRDFVAKVFPIFVNAHLPKLNQYVQEAIESAIRQREQLYKKLSEKGTQDPGAARVFERQAELSTPESKAMAKESRKLARADRLTSAEYRTEQLRYEEEVSRGAAIDLTGEVLGEGSGFQVDEERTTADPAQMELDELIKLQQLDMDDGASPTTRLLEQHIRDLASASRKYGSLYKETKLFETRALQLIENMTRGEKAEWTARIVSARDYGEG